MNMGVGDKLGTNDIADEMIRFISFPFLDKEDYGFHMSGIYMSLETQHFD
jgi:hypothetical protein